MRLYKRPKSPNWWYDFTVEVNGTPERVRASSATASKTDAALIAGEHKRDLLLEARLGPKKAAKTWSLEEACVNYWVEHARFTPSADNLARDMTNLQRLLGPATPLTAIDNSMISSEFVSRRRGEPAKGRKGALMSNRSVNSEVETLRAIMNRADDIHDVEIPRIKWRKLLLAESDPRTRYLSVPELELLLPECAPHFRPVVLAALWSGFRKSNLLFDWGDIDMHAREIDVGTKSNMPGGKRHVIPIVQPFFMLLANLGPKESGPVFTYTPTHPAHTRIREALDTLERHKGNYSAAARELGLTDNGLRKRIASAGKIPEPRPLKNFESAWKGARRRAGITDFRFHDLRHTCASWMVQNGIAIEVVKEVLGHADIQTTLRYAHHKTGAKQAALDSLKSQLRHTDGTPEVNESIKTMKG